MEVPVLIDDIRSRGCLERVNIAHASALVAATNDDLANINVVLDARRIKPDIRVVIRLFDDDLASTMRETLSAEAMSTTAVAAPVLALAAIDPRIQHSFRVGPHLMVVSEFVAGQGLVGTTVGRIRDEFGGLTLALRGLDGHERLHPPEGVKVAKAEVLTVQAELNDYLRMRRHTGEERVPLSARR
jgi:Trk K+ transport system NAD-binding subunit